MTTTTYLGPCSVGGKGPKVSIEAHTKGSYTSVVVHSGTANVFRDLFFIPCWVAEYMVMVLLYDVHVTVLCYDGVNVLVCRRPLEHLGMSV